MFAVHLTYHITPVLSVLDVVIGDVESIWLKEKA
jgi:hypothetical protein